MIENLNWDPFLLCKPNEQAPAPRSIRTLEGMGDRLRAAAFAEMQAARAFTWAAETFSDVPEGLRSGWLTLVTEEEKHFQWLMNRMAELEIQIQERPVSLRLWKTCLSCTSGREFALLIADAENKGRLAGERFFHSIRPIDPITAEIFKKIAEEEISHIELAQRFIH